ncbi:MAG TPA: CAP domain-containing protein [Anaerolineales bacterium]|nr:CAP domain-containing protein [Anaerolineales bacterium]
METRLRVVIGLATSILVASCGAGGLSFPPAVASSESTASVDATAPAIDLAAETTRLRANLNTLRQSQGAGDLTFPASLQQVALARALEIASQGSLDHERPGEATAAIMPMLEADGYSGRIAEFAILVRDPGDRLSATVLRAWFEDAAHRADLLDPGYQAAGIGIAETAGGWVAVQVMVEFVPSGEAQP